MALETPADVTDRTSCKQLQSNGSGWMQQVKSSTSVSETSNHTSTSRLYDMARARPQHDL
jgi:hypothetical protein